jgi:hypothetical protein
MKVTREPSKTWQEEWRRWLKDLDVATFALEDATPQEIAMHFFRAGRISAFHEAGQVMKNTAIRLTKSEAPK